MNSQDYTTTIVLEQTAKEAFDAINNVRAWWSEEVNGGTEQLNDEFTYYYKDVHRCKIRLIEVIPNKKVVWLVLDNHFNITENNNEWTGTKITFEIYEADNGTKIHFSHLGLLPDFECYHICSNAWGGYINGNLRSLITKGKGQPNLKEVN